MKVKNIFRAAALACVAVAVTGCTDGNDWGIDDAYARLFGINSSNISVEASDISAEVTFSSVPDAQYYIIEISTDSLYNDIAMGGTTGSKVYGADKDIIKSPATLTGLNGDTRYYLRIKAMSDAKAESHWTYYKNGQTFKTEAEQIFNEIASSDIGDGTVRVTWDPSAEVTHIVVSIGEEVVQTINLSTADKAAGEYTITGLNPTTTYSITIYNGDAKRGQRNITTPASMPTADFKFFLPEGSTELTQDMLMEIAAQAQEAAGSTTNYSATIGIPAGLTIDMHGTSMEGDNTTLKIPDGMSVTFFGLAGGDAPILKLSKSVDIAGSHAYVRFENVQITDGGMSYLINQSTACTLEELSFKDVKFYDMPRSMVRLQGDAAKTINNLILDNCFVKNEGSGGYALLYFNNAAYTVANIVIKNSTFVQLKHNFIQCANAITNKVTVSDCTFYNIIGSGRYFIDANGNDTNIDLVNCIFGKTYTEEASRGLRTAGTYTATNCYQTTDFNIVSNKFAVDMEYNGSSSDIFTDPENDNFTLKETLGAGDPEWYPAN